MAAGGKRKGAGRPKGLRMPSTLTKEAAREALRQRVTKEMDVMLDAMIATVKGLKHFFLRDAKTKQFTRITDPNEIENALNTGKEGENFWIFTKDPSVQAFTDLANRALDKPAEHVNLAGHDGGPLIVKWKT